MRQNDQYMSIYVRICVSICQYMPVRFGKCQIDFLELFDEIFNLISQEYIQLMLGDPFLDEKKRLNANACTFRT